MNEIKLSTICNFFAPESDYCGKSGLLAIQSYMHGTIIAYACASFVTKTKHSHMVSQHTHAHMRATKLNALHVACCVISMKF